MTRLLLVLLSVAALGYMAYWGMYGTVRGASEKSPPKQQLENVHRKAKAFEQRDQQNLDDIARKTQE